MRRWLLRLPAPLFALGALFHVSTLFDPSLGEASPPWRHALFVVLNGTFAALFAWRPRWLVWAYLPLAAQQTWSHGAELVASPAPWHEAQSLLALVSIPLFLAVAVVREPPRPRVQEGATRMNRG